MEFREPTEGEQLLYNRIVALEAAYNQERDRADETARSWLNMRDERDAATGRADALSSTNTELLSTLAACQKALHDCSLMLTHLNCPGHAAVAAIHSEAALAAIARAKGE